MERTRGNKVVQTYNINQEGDSDLQDLELELDQQESTLGIADVEVVEAGIWQLCRNLILAAVVVKASPGWISETEFIYLRQG